MNSYIITGTGITLFFADTNTQHTIKSDHPKFAEICSMAAKDEFEWIADAIDIRGAIDKFLYTSDNGRFAIEHGVLTFDGEQIHNTLAERMIEMAIKGLDLTAMENFMVNLFDNPSYRAVTELYNFLEAGKLPITPDGHFLAYKKIRDDYTDVHSGKFDNSVGTVVEMKRHAVNDNRDITCAEGLHFCSYDYLNCFGGQRVVVLKINPRDVVSIPSDYNDTKGRCCRYEVIREIEDWVSDRIEGSVSFDGTYDDDDYDEYGYDDDGYDADGYDDDGFDRNGYDSSGFDASGYDEDGYDEDGVDRFGVDAYADDDGEDDDYVGETEFDISDGNVVGSSYEELQSALLNPEVKSFTVPAQPAPEPQGDVRMQIQAINIRNGVKYIYDTLEAAHQETQVPVEYIARVLEGNAGSSMGYKFTLIPAE